MPFWPMRMRPPNMHKNEIHLQGLATAPPVRTAGLGHRPPPWEATHGLGSRWERWPRSTSNVSLEFQISQARRDAERDRLERWTQTAGKHRRGAFGSAGRDLREMNLRLDMATEFDLSFHYGCLFFLCVYLGPAQHLFPSTIMAP